VTARIAFIVAVVVASQTPQTFRTTTDLVMVDVSVRSGDRAVTNLTAADFVLTDNGVRQKIESVEPTAVPIDVTLVVDLSGNPRRPRGPRLSRAKVIADLREEVDQVTKILRPSDRVRLLAIDTYVRQIWPFLPVAELPAISLVEFDGLGAVYEGIAAALLQPVEPARRHVIVARAKGVDTASSIGAPAVGAIAARSDALFHLVIMEEAKDQDRAVSSWQCAILGLCWATNRYWVPFRRDLIGVVPNQVPNRPPHDILPDGQILKTGAEATGGAWHQMAMITTPSLTGTFRRAFDDFREGYVLRYTPQGVTRGGWHRIDVTLTKPQGFRVRARRGYGIDEAPPAPPPPPIPRGPRTLDELTDAYARGAFPNVATGLRQAGDPGRLLREFREGGNPWPAAPHREAAFAVDLAEAGLFATGDDARKAATSMLERFTRFVRHPLGPNEFERQWHLAVVMLVQGTLRPGVAQPFVDRALARFPSDPQFLLARAIVSEQFLQVGGPKPGVGPRPGPTYEEVRRSYEAAMAAPSVATEARIRLALRLHLRQQSKEALALLDVTNVDPTQTPTLAYLRELFRGHALGALDRPDDAMAAYREALLIVPPGQAARVALMRRLLERGNSDEAEALADLVQTERSPALDPWWMYWQGQYRLYPQAIARVREMSR
jgi:tetratricopeptide (TPR) repeat protein